MKPPRARIAGRGAGAAAGLALAVLAGVAHGADTRGSTPRVVLPPYRLAASALGVIVNDADPLSVRIARYYRKRRHIPRGNLIHVRFEPGHTVLTPDQFKRIRAQVKLSAPPRVQAYALTWAEPFRVGCMSITSAFALGFHKAYCATRCAPTRAVPYFDSPSHAPYRDLGIRPTMALAARTFAGAKALIDRGVRADGSRPEGTAYLVSTPDRARNVRADLFPAIRRIFGPLIHVDIVHGRGIRHRSDVLFYFTGTTEVPYLSTLGFRPGAMADHLTSAGGQLIGSPQMSSLRWLQAGATGSYGTVVEPCNYRQKFPNPAVAMRWYLRGTTLLEAYWKSVRWPGQGIFIGEPLASPYGGYRLRRQGGRWELTTWALAPGRYRVQTAPSPVGPYRTRPAVLDVRFGQHRFALPRYAAAVYRLQRLAPAAPGAISTGPRRPFP